MIEGKVAAIISEEFLAINVGSEDGVTEGMRFEVLEPEGVEITDPDDPADVLGEEIGVKIHVKVTRVEPRYSVARSDETIGGYGFGLAGALISSSTAPRQRTFRTEEAIFKPLAEEKSFVKRGDRVRQIVNK